MNKNHVFTQEIGGHTIEFATGRLAEQAGGAVTVRMGDSMLLVTTTMSAHPREGLDFFPLMVDFEEKMYAAGRIPGSFFRREGRPSSDAILTSRLTDRPLRPLFPDGMRNEVQVIITTLSSDSEYHLDIMSINGASAALSISNIPWNGPVAAVRVAYIDGELVASPTIPQMADSTLDLRLAGTRDAIVMVEAGGSEVSEELFIEALAFGHKAMQPLIDLQLEMQAAIGKPKDEPAQITTDPVLADAVKARMGNRIHELVVTHTDRHALNDAVGELREEIVNSFLEEATEDNPLDPKAVREVIGYELKQAVRRRILVDGVRTDGRDYTTIRDLSADVAISPRAHGSGLFRRGETQVLSIAALGTPREAQKLDGLYPEDTRRYIHHYNFPPFSTGETWPLRGPKRREIGHGALAENALVPVLPSEDDFPYTIRVVSEVLSSNGSTSMGSVCASSLALMDCGVPIVKPVAGIAMGLVKEGEQYAILTDIQGMEDHLGDMDFKVAGTADGITAIQMDIKIGGLSQELMSQALHQARAARLQILEVMNGVIPAPRTELSTWAPRMESIHIDPDKIGAIIGKGGSTIRALEEEYDVSIDIQDDGTVFVAAVDGIKGEAAMEAIRGITAGPELGKIYTGRVVRITDFGAFVEIVPGTDGLVHISQISSEHVKRVEDALHQGDEVMVMVTDIDPANDKVRLSRVAVLEGWDLEEARANDNAIGSGGSRGGRGGRGGRNGRGGRRRR